MQHRIGQIIAVPLILRSVRRAEQRGLPVLFEHRRLRNVDRYAQLFFSLIVFVRSVIDEFGKFLRRQFYLIPVAVTQMHNLAFHKQNFIAQLPRIALHIHELATLFDAVVVYEVGIVRVFGITRRHPHERGFFIRLDECIPRYKNPIPFFGRIDIPAVILFPIFVCRFFVLEIVHALRPRPVRRVVADCNGKVIFPLHDRNIPAVLVPHDAYDLVAPRRFFQIFALCQLFCLLFLLFCIVLHYFA